MSDNRTTKLNKNKTHLSFYFSALFHILILLFSFVLPKFNSAKEQPSEIEITFDSTAEQKAELLQDPTKIVEFDKSETDDKINKNAKYLAAKNNTVKKQTIAQLDQQFRNLKNNKKEISQKRSNSENSDWQKKPDHRVQAKLFNTGFDVYDKMQNPKNTSYKAALENTIRKETSTSTDKLVDAEQSLMTQLNTREYKYYGYYTRIRQQLNQWWQPKVQEKVSKLMSKGRTIASDANKNTSVIIVLNNLGSLVGVQVVGASGVRELDDAAVEAFRQTDSSIIKRRK